MATQKIYTIETTKSRSLGTDSVEEYTGTVSELIKAFSYILEVGNSWNRKIVRKPQTIKSLIKNIELSYIEKEGGYSSTSIKLVN